jgi:hypothetical protein
VQQQQQQQQQRCIVAAAIALQLRYELRYGLFLNSAVTVYCLYASAV